MSGVDQRDVRLQAQAQARPQAPVAWLTGLSGVGKSTIAALASAALVERGIAPVISPYREARAGARELIGEPFLEVHVRASLETLERRDTKGLYAKARAGEIERLTGVSDPYEAPEAPDLVLDTESESAERSARRLLELIASRLPPASDDVHGLTRPTPENERA